MVSTVLAGLLQNYLGQYLELSDTSISVGSEVKLYNVRLKESAFADLGLPLGLPIKCVHGKVAKLVIKIPWFNLWTKSTVIELEGLHLLLVPSTSVLYDEATEKKVSFEAKQKRLQKAEEAKQLDLAEEEEKNKDQQSDSFVQRLLATIIKNLEITITKVHIRYEDNQTNSSGYPFAAGITLAKLLLTTTSADQEEKGVLKVFGKKVILESFAIYWRPKANLHSSDANIREDAIDLMFDQNIGTREKPASKLKYLLGPICSEAKLMWCPSPAKFDYKQPQLDLSIQMEELCLQLTKYQYHDFMMLLQSLEYIQRASQFRKYKARHGLEGIHNYAKRYKDLWKFAFDAVYEEEVMRKINNWSWNHMKEHLEMCKSYRLLFKKKLMAKKPGQDLLKEILSLEETLDEVNIRIQRQLAEREVEKVIASEAKPASSGGIWGWFSKSKTSEADDGQNGGKLAKRLEGALSTEEKAKLYEVIDYQENAHHGIYPKSFVANKMSFSLESLKITIRDEDLKDAQVVQLNLASVQCNIMQRPSADNISLAMTMETLTIAGLRCQGRQACPLIVTTRSGSEAEQLLNISFEKNPPHDPLGDLDKDEGSLYDQRINVFSSPLEITYDKYTFNALMSLFKTPDEINLVVLQQQAAAKLKEYKESSALGLKYVIDHHSLMDVDIHLKSSIVVIPLSGIFSDNCACSVLSLGSISVVSTKITEETKKFKDKDFTQVLMESIRDQAYDKFNLTMENIQLLVALPNENWRRELDQTTSSLFLLSPTTVKVLVQVCLVKNDPELPIVKVTGNLNHINVNISDYRLIKLAQILDSLVEQGPVPSHPLERTDSNESMQSALSSLANTGTFSMSTMATASSVVLAKMKDGMEEETKTSLQLTQMTLDFQIDHVNFKMSQLAKQSNHDEEIFNFVLDELKVEAAVRSFDLYGKLNVGCLSCTHLLVHAPSGEPVRIISSRSDKGKLLTVEYFDVKKDSPQLHSDHQSILKKLDVTFAGVDIIIHQNAIMDLVDKVTKFTDEVMSNAKNLLLNVPDKVSEEAMLPSSPKPQEAPATPRALQRKLSRKLSFQTAANMSRWSARAKLKSVSRIDTVDLKVTAMLESVTFQLMTSHVSVASMKVQNLQSTFTQTKDLKRATAKLVNFEILDASKSMTFYRKIAESMDERVFDAEISLFHHSPNEKAQNMDLVDVKIVAKMGRVKLVFLMKFVNDFLAFIEPFSGAKDMVAEKAENALEEATKTMIDAYASQTRAQLNISMDAPLIIIPISSKNKVTLLADLGTLHLSNRFFADSNGVIFDDMRFNLSDLKLNRAKLNEDIDCNDIEATCPIIEPINFELEIKRNMGGAKTKDDPAELVINGTLYQIKAQLSKGDYNVVMAILQDNFSEKGDLELDKRKSTQDKAALMLPIKSKYAGSRTSLSSGSAKSLRTAMKVPDRSPEAKAVVFSFNFRGLNAEMFTGRTDLDSEMSFKRDPSQSLAKVSIQLLKVDGVMQLSGALRAKAFLQNLVLEDSRLHVEPPEDPTVEANRIVRLMEAKDPSQKMIEIDYSKEGNGDQNVEIFIHSFIVVGSVAYLLEIANFFVPDEAMTMEWRSEGLGSDQVANEVDPEISNRMSVYVKIEEPDIFLVENIANSDSDALMLNTELQFKFWSVPKDNAMSMMASLSNIRCHTCRFNPQLREETMAQILQPCTLSFTISQNEDHGVRVQCNMSDLCLNVSPRSIEIIRNSVEAFIESMAVQDPSEATLSERDEDFTNLWLPKPYDSSKLWFLRNLDYHEKGKDALDSLSSNTLQSSLAKDEQAIIKINNLVVKIEAGVGNNTIPLLLVESSLSCNINDWSSRRMTLIGSVNVEMAYYNAKLALWEPVIEPLATLYSPDGNVVRKRWDMNVTMQQNASSDFGSAIASPNFDEVDGFITPQNMPPLMALSLQSTETLEITVTKSLIGVLQTLASSFSQVSSATRKEVSAPFVVQNCLGKEVTVFLENKDFKYFKFGEKYGDSGNTIEVPIGETVQLVLFRDRSKDVTSYISPLQEQSEQAEASLKLKVKGEKGFFEIPVCKADKRFYPFQFRGDERGDMHGMISEIIVENGAKFISLKTIIDIKNHYPKPVNIFRFDGKSKFEKLAQIQPDETFSVPLAAVYEDPYEFYFQIAGPGETMSYEAFNWRQLVDLESFSKQILCANTQGRPEIYLNIEGVKEEVFWEKTGKLTGIAYSLDIRPLVVLKNCLPVAIHFAVGGSSNSTNLTMMDIEPGQSGHIQIFKLGFSTLHMKIFEFRETDWSCSQLVEKEFGEVSTWRFYSIPDQDGNQAKIDLDINSVISHGTQVLSIYAPFWMINKTGKNLTYRGQDPQNVINHPLQLENVPMMFSYSKKLLGKRKASVKIENTNWSDPFTLDTIEDAGKVSCKSKTETFHLGVNINMSKSSLTKIITFTPFHMIFNTMDYGIELWELESADQDSHVKVGPGQMMPFWPIHGANEVVARITGTKEITAPFTLQNVHTTLLMLGNRFGGMHVDVRSSASETLLTISAYKKGLAPVQLINHTKHQMIRYGEKGNAASEMWYLSPGESSYYTWINPKGERNLAWAVDIGKSSHEIENTLQTDGQGCLDLGQNKCLAWVSFLDGMQRVLLFSDDPSLCYSLAHSTGEHERIAQEIDLSIFGIGISLVNNTCFQSNHEIIYLSISSSDIVWELRRQGKSRYKSLTKSQCEAIERDFQFYEREKSIGKRTQSHRHIQVESSRKPVEVDYDQMKMFIPDQGYLRRQFQKGLWLQIRTSTHQRQVHAKINRIQIDNQLTNCLFPVILAPVPPPKSVMADSIPKPFMELSLLQYVSPEHTNLSQYKYICALVQEVHLKIDQGFLNAIMDFFAAEEEILDEDINEFLKEDLSLARRELKDVATLRVTQGQKDFFDYLHLSPLKVHVSFSLTSYQSAKGKTNRRSNFFSLFLQSLGVTITDTDDIVFRLAYFERKHNFYSTEDLFKEMIRHYSSQALKQVYVLIFGLDVIGNPFGLVVGVTKSVEDLFYEPFQGAVEGPSEFAEGLFIGARSVFSGVVGGAAGTVSRITGALGKGIASLTFDDKFQKKRREAIKKRGTQNFGESLARSSKGLAMGIFEGVTGVATKPIEGAMEEGVGGFFKGVGKGVVGLVARPTGGIVDFASGTFDSVKRVTETAEYAERKRPPRFLDSDGVVRYYNLKKAEGCKYLRELEKGKYAESDLYVTHELVPADKPSLIMVSSKRVLFMTYQSVLGNWSLDWEYLYLDITGPPPTGEESDKAFIIIKPKGEKKSSFFGFGSSDTGKKVFVSSRLAAKHLARVIEELRTSQN